MAANIPPPILFLFRALHAEMNVSLIVIGAQLGIRFTPAP
jgi:hypothetical protein